MKSAKTVAQEIFDHMRKNNLNYLALNYEDYYSLLGERPMSYPSFEEKLRNEIRHREILVCFGNFGVFFCKDANFAPVDLSEFLSYRNSVQ